MPARRSLRLSHGHVSPQAATRAAATPAVAGSPSATTARPGDSGAGRPAAATAAPLSISAASACWLTASPGSRLRGDDGCGDDGSRGSRGLRL
jgi:hypothetical protein